jgi:hypothetical protein
MTEKTTKPLSGGRLVIYTMPDTERSHRSHEYPAMVTEVDEAGLANLLVFTPSGTHVRQAVALNTSGAHSTYRELPKVTAAPAKETATED